MQLSFVAPSAVNSGVWVVAAAEGPNLLLYKPAIKYMYKEG